MLRTFCDLGQGSGNLVIDELIHSFSKLGLGCRPCQAELVGVHIALLLVGWSPLPCGLGLLG